MKKPWLALLIAAVWFEPMKSSACFKQSSRSHWKLPGVAECMVDHILPCMGIAIKLQHVNLIQLGDFDGWII